MLISRFIVEKDLLVTEISVNHRERSAKMKIFSYTLLKKRRFFKVHLISFLECLAVFHLFDDLERLIEHEQQDDKRDEFTYDFQLAREDIFEMFRHRIRTVQQDAAKARTLASMSKTTAFQTIDWAQKILPQSFREGQSAYYGKKGMSALVGSFTFYDTSGKRLLSNIFSTNVPICHRKINYTYIHIMSHTL